MLFGYFSRLDTYIRLVCVGEDQRTNTKDTCLKEIKWTMSSNFSNYSTLNSEHNVIDTESTNMLFRYISITKSWGLQFSSLILYRRFANATKSCIV